MEHRSLSTIAEEISRNWLKPYFGASPYIRAMHQLKNINDNYYEDSAGSIVRYFLANAQTWKGETARRIKNELKNLLKEEEV